MMTFGAVDLMFFSACRVSLRRTSITRLGRVGMTSRRLPGGVSAQLVSEPRLSEMRQPHEGDRPEHTGRREQQRRRQDERDGRAQDGR